MKQLFNSLKNIPYTVRLFLGKALLFFIAWKLIYSFFLFDSQLIDRVLTKHVGEASVYVLNTFNSSALFSSKIETYQSEYGGEQLNNAVSAIYFKEKKALHIANVCNGLELLVLYVGFIVCMPSTIKRKLIYIVFGVVFIDFINVLRCVGLIYLYEYFNVYFEFAHHYLFKAIIYLATFLLWMRFSRKININDKPL